MLTSAHYSQGRESGATRRKYRAPPTDSEIQPQCELKLTVGSQSRIENYSLTEQSECPSRRSLSLGFPRLTYFRPAPNPKNTPPQPTQLTSPIYPATGNYKPPPSTTLT